jgi:aspartyl protease family protein
MEDNVSIVYAVGALILVVSSLAARRLPVGSLAKMAAAWVAVFALLFLVIGYRFEIKQIWNHVKSDFAGTGNQQVSGDGVRLKRGDDGHFSAVLQINGHPVEFLIDTGATVTSLSAKSAGDAGIDVNRSGFPVIVDTANGRVKDWRAVAQKMVLETIIVNDHPVLISDALSDDQNLIGMNFLDQLASWRVEGDFMILVPQADNP